MSSLLALVTFAIGFVVMQLAVWEQMRSRKRA